MKLSRFLAPVFVFSFVGSMSPQGPSISALGHQIGCNSPAPAIYETAQFFSEPTAGEFYEDTVGATEHHVIPTPTDGGIKLDVKPKYQERFDRWKDELLSTDFGRQQWDSYANRKDFILTITVSNDTGKGAGTGKYLWDDQGRFVGATITLGDDLDRGYPGPVYYPVMNSLSLDEASYMINPRILAATKFAHEFGHVDQTSRANGEAMRRQDKLMPLYNSIFLKNGLKTSDTKLIDLAKEMGGTPIEIWESREYWSEVEAMAYLKERISKENFYCRVFSKIKQNVEEYARDYRDRFEKDPNFTGSPCWN